MTVQKLTSTRNARPLVSESGTASVLHMATSSAHPRTGRPSKGDRRAFHVRMPRETADRVMAYAVATGTTYSDVISDLVERHRDEIDPNDIELGTNRLDVEVTRDTA